MSTPDGRSQPGTAHLTDPQKEGDTGGNNKHVRVWMDGSFDMLHVGHISAMYKARAHGDVLVVGAQSDADVQLHKGPPVYPELERFRLIQALSCVDEFVGAASYGTSIETLDAHGCDFCVHGDDATLRASDTDPVKKLINVNRAKLVPRGIGPSTTNCIERILQRTEKASTENITAAAVGSSRRTENEKTRCGPETTPTMAASHIRVFLDTRAPRPDDTVVYVDGAFDLFSHLSFLEKAAQQGTYLLVGIHADSIVANRRGDVFPVQDLIERGLVVCSFKIVDDVLFGAPFAITDEILDSYKIDVVCHGKNSTQDESGWADRYEIPMKRGILRQIESESDVTTESVVSRIVKRRAEFVARNKRKFEKENNAAKKLWDS